MKFTGRIAWSLALLGLLVSGCEGLVTSETTTSSRNIGSEGGTVELEGTRVEIPPGAVEGTGKLLLRRAATHPDGNIGRAWEIDWTGGGFGTPVQVSLPIGPDELPAGVLYTDLRLAWVEDGAWRTLDGSMGFGAMGAVLGETTHLSVWGIVEAPECIEDEDCPQGQTCQDGGCVGAATCYIWGHVSEQEVQEAMAPCDPGTCPGIGDGVIPLMEVEGVFGGAAVHRVDAFFNEDLKSEGKKWTFNLPCDGFVLVLTAAGSFSDFEQGGTHPVVDSECVGPDAQASCACTVCATAVLSRNGHTQAATGGHVKLRCDPTDYEGSFSGCLEEVELDFVEWPGGTVRFATGQSGDWLTGEEWVAAASSVTDLHEPCMVTVSATVTFYEETCYLGAVAKCGDYHIKVNDGLDGEPSCQQDGLSCEGPAIEVHEYSLDVLGDDCGLCLGSQAKDENHCTNLPVQCGGTVPVEWVAAGSEETGPAPPGGCEECPGSAAWCACMSSKDNDAKYEEYCNCMDSPSVPGGDSQLYCGCCFFAYDPTFDEYEEEWQYLVVNTCDPNGYTPPCTFD